MWIHNETYLEDLRRICSADYLPWQQLSGKTVLVTGATGLVGSNVVNALLYQGMSEPDPCRVIALVRNREKAASIFRQQLLDCPGRLIFAEGDITSPIALPGQVDYIIHGASQTASVEFVRHPVETIETAVWGTRHLLELAREKQAASFVYLSSMEAYGSPHTEQPLREDAPACFDTMSPRSCYPESKRMCEALCCAYAQEYRVPAKVVRLAQTFGPGVPKEDTRVFVDFSRKALKGEDIVLRTKGDSCRMYLYTMDAAAAILTVLLRGEAGECYNAANTQTYCSIREMAELVSSVLSGGRSRVTVQLDEQAQKIFPPAHKLYLDTSKLEKLGWKANYTLSDMYQRMVKGF